MKLRVAIIANTKNDLDFLASLLSKKAEIQIVGRANDKVEALRLLTSLMTDLAILDMQFWEEDIFSVFNEIRNPDEIMCERIFITQHEEYSLAVQAIRLGCLDLITKPVLNLELENALQKAGKRIAQKAQPSQKAQLLYLLEHYHRHQQRSQSIDIIRAKGVIEFHNLQDIISLEADGNVCRIQFKDGSRRTSFRHLGYYKDFLIPNHQFVQVSRTYLINAFNLLSYHSHSRIITMQKGKKIQASVRFSRHLKQKLQDLQLEETTINQRIEQINSIFKK